MSKFRHIQIKNDDENKPVKKFSRQINAGKVKSNQKTGASTSNTDKKNSKLNKTIESDEKRIKKKNKDIMDSNDDNPKQIRARSQARRKINKVNDLDNSKKVNNPSSSYEKRNIKTKKSIEINKNNNDEIKKIKKIGNKIKIKKNSINSNNDDEDNDLKIKRNSKKTKTEMPKQGFMSLKSKETKKSMGDKKMLKSEKNEKSNISFDIKVSKFKKDDKNKENNNKNGKKFLKNKEKTVTTRIMKKKTKKIEEEDEDNLEKEKKTVKRKKIIGKSVDRINNKKKIDNKIKKTLVKKKTIKKKEESESESESNNSDSESGSDSESSKSSNSSKSSKSSKNSKSSKRSKSSKSSKSSKKSKSSNKTISSKKSESSSNRSSSSPTPSSSGSNSEDEKDNKKLEVLKTFNKSKTGVDKQNIKLDDTNKQNQKDSEKDKEKQKTENQQILNNIPKLPVADGRKGSIILGSQYLRRRSMDNPFTRERLELLVNQMTLKQNGGNTLFLKNYESGPSYKKDITFITKDKKSIKKHIKIDECTKAGCSGPGIVKTNQDAYFVKENFLKNSEYFYIGVCDGHGEQGHVVSNYVINKLPSYIKDLSNETITEAFKKINKEIYASSKMDSNMSGTTVVSIILTPNNIICVNLGDSRASLFRYENGLYYCRNLSRDHKPSEPDESKRIVNSGGRVKKCYDEEHKRFIGPDRVWMKNKEEPGLAMTRSLGDKIAHNIGVSDEPEFKTFTYDGTEKFIILASDGLWEYVNGDQCINIVKPFYEEGKDSKEAALALTKEAFRKWKRKEVAIDDITVIVIFFD